MSELFTLKFQLRKPYNEASQLIECFNQIIDEGGRAEIVLSQIRKDEKETIIDYIGNKNNSNVQHNGYVLQLKLYRCRNSYIATSLGARIINKFTPIELLSITKFNMASVYNSPVKFKVIPESQGSDYGPEIQVTLFEHDNENIKKILRDNFDLIDLSIKSN